MEEEHRQHRLHTGLSGERGDEAAIDRRVEMSQEAEEEVEDEDEEEGKEMKHCRTLAVYPTLLDVKCACASACC